MSRPVIGITADVADGRHRVGVGYARMVEEAGGVPIVLPPALGAIEQYLDMCAGVVLSGGDDPDMTAFGEVMHPNATPVDPDRQSFETALLQALDQQPRPVLGVCLGMQMMGLVAGGHLDQHLPDTLATHAMHWGRHDHAIEGELGAGTVHSHHRQALTDAGGMRVVSRAPDGVIEAIRDDSHEFALGVQWHPERTADDQFGIQLFRNLVNVCR